MTTHHMCLIAGTHNVFHCALFSDTRVSAVDLRRFGLPACYRRTLMLIEAAANIKSMSKVCVPSQNMNTNA